MLTPQPADPSTVPRHLPTRRTLARGAAWAVPVLAVGSAAPAFAASCAPWRYTLDWGGSATSTYTRVSNVSASATVTSTDVGAPLVNVFVSATVPVGEPVQPRFDNLEVSAGPIGGTGDVGLLLRQVQASTGGNPPGPDAAMAVTFAFDHTVTDLAFTVTDIDSSSTASRFVDQVHLTPAPPEVVLADPSYLQGVGSSAQPLQPIATDEPLDDESSGRGNASVGFGGVDAVTLTLRNGTVFAFESEVAQSVFLTSMSFSVVPDTC